MKNKWIYVTLGLAAGIIIDRCSQYRMLEKKYRQEIIEKQNFSDKHLSMFLLMNEWKKLKQDGKCISTYLRQGNYNKIVIYGMGSIGERLVDELIDDGIEIAYIMDKSRKGTYRDIKIWNDFENLPQADAVIVSAIFYYDEIVEELEKKMNAKIINLEDIIYEI